MTPPTGISEQTGLSFQIKIPNLELREEEEAAANESTPSVKISWSQPSQANVEASRKILLQHQSESKVVGDCSLIPECHVIEDDSSQPQLSTNEDMESAESESSSTKMPAMSRIRSPHIRHMARGDDNSNSSCDSVYFDAMDEGQTGWDSTLSTTPEHLTEDIADHTSHNATGPNTHDATANTQDDTTLNVNQQTTYHPSSHNPTNQPPPTSENTSHDASDDSGFEMAEEMPRFFYHDARIARFVYGEHKVFALYVDGSMIQEHTKDIINSSDEKNDVAKKKD